MGCVFPDVRHGKRLRQLLEQLSSRVGSSTPWACQDWANTKAAYRFFGNDRVSEGNILAGHFASTRDPFPPNLPLASAQWYETTGWLSWLLLRHGLLLSVSTTLEAEYSASIFKRVQLVGN